MAQSIPLPDLQVLLPPLLACLAAACASASSKPPPAISPLLTPILRQRVLLLSDPSPSESWLSLLSWNSDKALRLPEIVRSDRFELHPVSGEVEFKDVESIQFRRLDEETVHAKVVLRELYLTIVYLWCVGDVEGCGGGWKVAEVIPYDEEEQYEKWYDSVSAMGQAKPAAQPLQSPLANGTDVRDYNEAPYRAVGDEDDEAYWRQYDGTPAPRTPPQPLLPASYSATSSSAHRRVASEEEYFAQYAQVQPALGNDDHQNQDGKEFDIPRREFRQTSNNNSNNRQGFSVLAATEHAGQISPNLPRLLTSTSRYVSSTSNTTGSPLSQPRPSFSSGSSVVARLEETAASEFWADVGVKQHLSASIKSLFRVSRVAGIGVEKFAMLLKNELRCSGRLEEGDTRGACRYISTSFYGLLRPARVAGIDRDEIERIVTTELAVLEMVGDEDRGLIGTG
ncbi:MAG: hypothetical protein M1839_003627 [Geoglossum umbratile]|nr:MAG: hypothetical protein M1839_003627 [Geoglossum umbratile]